MNHSSWIAAPLDHCACHPMRLCCAHVPCCPIMSHTCKCNVQRRKSASLHSENPHAQSPVPPPCHPITRRACWVREALARSGRATRTGPKRAANKRQHIHGCHNGWIRGPGIEAQLCFNLHPRRRGNHSVDPLHWRHPLPLPTPPKAPTFSRNAEFGGEWDRERVVSDSFGHSPATYGCCFAFWPWLVVVVVVHVGVHAVVLCAFVATIDLFSVSFLIGNIS